MSSSEVGRKFVFWVVYDATGDQAVSESDNKRNIVAYCKPQELSRDNQ